MTSARELMAEIYTAFNQRDIDAALDRMSDAVSWPKASEGGRVVGKDAIRAYWTRQWQEFDPQVHALEVLEPEPGKVHVRVHQLVRSLAGEVLSDSEVWHHYTLADGQIERMDLEGSEANSDASSAFARH